MNKPKQAHKRIKKPVSGEVATTRDGRDITRGYVDALPYLYPMDRVLRLQGGHNYELYEEVLRDDQVHAVFAQRRLAVVAKETKVIPGGSMKRDRMAAAFIEEMLEHIRWDTVTDRMLYGRFYGYAVAEALWVRDGQHIMLDRLAVRNRRRFVFDVDFNPKLITTNNPDGEVLPEKKFWCLTTGADNDDEPYGLGLAHWLYWTVFFKRNQSKFWLVALEKFGSPTVIGKYPRNASDIDKRTLDEALAAVRVDTGIRIPADMMIELLQAAKTGTMDYAAFYDRMNSAISKVVLGQTMTTDDGSSKSQADVHMTVRDDIVGSDARLICDSFNRTIVRWLIDWNFPGAAYPRVSRNMDIAPDLKSLAERDEIIIRMMGKQPDDEYIEQTYGVKLVTPVIPAKERHSRESGNPVKHESGEAGHSQGVDFAEADLSPLEQALDAIDAAISGEDGEAIASPLIQPILNQAKADPEALMTDLASLYPQLDSDALEQQLAQIIFVADTWGRLQEQEQSDA